MEASHSILTWFTTGFIIWLFALAMAASLCGAAGRPVPSREDYL